jgi:hypothetical protein
VHLVPRRPFAILALMLASAGLVLLVQQVAERAFRQD